MKQVGILIFAIFLGAAAVALMHLYIVQKTKTGEQEYVSVLVAARDIPQGTALDVSMLKEDKMPLKWRNPQTLHPNDMELILGQITATPLKKDQPILWSDIHGIVTEPPVAHLIEVGQRAIAIPVDEVSGIAGLIHPDDHVDIIGTFETPREMVLTEANIKKEDRMAEALEALGRGGRLEVKRTTLTLLQNVLVLAVGNIVGGTVRGSVLPGLLPGAGGEGAQITPAMAMQRANLMGGGQGRAYATVTLLVTPLSAEILVFSLEQGKLSLALRNPSDLEILKDEDLPKITFTNIIKPEIRRRAHREMEERITIIRGGD